MDAGSGAPVRAANVSLRATEYSTRTDSAGRFVLDDVLPARYQVDVESPSVASLGLDGSATESVDLRDTGTVTVALRTPALRDAVTRACAGEHPGTYNTKGGLLRGTIRQPDGTPASGATVLARWLGHVDLQGSGVVGVSAQELHATTIVGADGAFRLCGVDLGRPIRLIATRDSLRSPLAIAWLSDTTLVTSVDLTLAGQKTAVPPDALP
jgi:hypothetical protein